MAGGLSFGVGESGACPPVRGAGSYHRRMIETIADAVDGMRRATATAALMIAAAATMTAATPAAADDFTDQANRPYAQIQGGQRSDTALLPVLAKLEPAPKAVETISQAMLLPANAAGWEEAAAWAQGKPQQEALQTLATITKERDWKKAKAFGQPYGIDGVPLEMIQAGLFTDLGDPPTLAAAKIQFLPSLDRLAILVHVEATRMAAAGKPNDAIDLLMNLMCLGRQMADRQLFPEVKWGLTQMKACAERIRDVAYVDSKGASATDASRLREQIKLLDDKSNAYLDVGRIAFPAGDRAAASQLVARMYRADGSVDEQVFATTMSRLGSTKRPLRLFSESGKWRTVAGGQADGAQAKQQVDALFNDWASRWTTPWFDKRMANVREYDRFERGQHAAAAAVVPDMSELQNLRHLVRVELAGTRTALGVFGYGKTIGKFPPQLTAIRPAWVPEIDVDPFNPTGAEGKRPGYEFFVPVRDAALVGAGGGAYEVEIVAGGTPFQVRLNDDTFVLYSVGSDNARNNAKRVQNTTDVVQGADYLIWPPAVSLVRQNLVDRGDLK